MDVNDTLLGKLSPWKSTTKFLKVGNGKQTNQMLWRLCEGTCWLTGNKEKKSEKIIGFFCLSHDSICKSDRKNNWKWTIPKPINDTVQWALNKNWLENSPPTNPSLQKKNIKKTYTPFMVMIFSFIPLVKPAALHHRTSWRIRSHILRHRHRPAAVEWQIRWHHWQVCRPTKRPSSCHCLVFSTSGSVQVLQVYCRLKLEANWCIHPERICSVKKFRCNKFKYEK